MWSAKLLVTLVAIGSVASSVGTGCKSSPCMYGICVDDPNIGAYRCYCIDGYTGINCEINHDDCWSNPCLNGGSCNDAIASYNCSCPEGFVGANCEQKYSECMNQPCLNNGTCVDNNAVFSCQCLEGFSGEFCEIDASVCNATVCKNSGECVEGAGLSFGCRCADGWAGRYCEDDVNECGGGVTTPCQNGGLCINVPGSYACACLFGFTGKDCDKNVVPCEQSLCQNSAVCLLEDAQPVCYCVPDYHGALCELRYDDCEAKYAQCENGGTCVDGINEFTCSCPAGFAGETCTLELTSSSSSSSSSEIVTSTEETVESRTEYSSEDYTAGEEQTTTVIYSRETMQPIPTSDATSWFTTTMLANDTWTTTPATTTSELYRPLETTVPSATAAVDTDYGESVSSGFSEGTTRRVVTMLPSTIVPPAEASPSTQRVGIPGQTTERLATMAQTTEAQTGITSSQVDFTTVTEFHRVTFGTEIDQSQVSSVPTTTEQLLLVHSCTAEQCANTSLCVYNATQCDCSYRDNCRESASGAVQNAAFNGKSYIRQKFSIEDGVLAIFARLKTKAKSGIIVHALFDDERYVLLYMEAGQLKFQFSCGLQTMLFGELDAPINSGHDVDVEMRFQYAVESLADKCSARLLVNGSVAMSGEQVLQTHGDAPRFARLHLGGIPLAFSHQFPQIAMGFVGCMSLLKVNGLDRDFIRDSIEAVQIEECVSFLCLSSPCKNFGACEELDGKIRCKCIAGYSGETCERSICDDNPCYLGATCLISPGANFICICPLGTHGLLCEKDTTIVQPSFSVFSPGFSSYMAYGVSSSIKDSMELKLQIVPQTLEQISLIAYMGQAGSKRDSSDHFSITFVRGYLMLTWDLGSGVRRIFTNTPLNVKSHKVHLIRIGRRGRDSWLYVEGIGNVTGRAAGTNTRLDASPILYIGGHKSKYFEILPHDLPLHTGFSGCIYDIELRTDDNVFPVTMSSPATGRGVGECHRNECSHHSCKNGAVCLNYGPTYSCICMKDWEGPDCSSPINCTSSNGALCHSRSK